MWHIKQIGIACLAWALKFACPWYLRELLSRYVAQPMLLAAFMVSVVIFGLCLPISRSSFYLVSLPRKIYQFDAPDEFDTTFPVPKELQYHVAFWKAVFSQYSRHQVLLHDSWYPQIVYEVIDLKSSQGLSTLLLKYRRILVSLHQKETSHRLGILTQEEARVYALFREISEPDRFEKAAYRLRIQCGQRESFLKAIQLSGVYQKRFDEIFQQYGLPTDLTRIPFVESYFNHRAYSYAGAAGIWQFMPATARMYGLRVNAKVDERYDPFKSAESAAQLLKANYELFGSWPLAITAYNHGPAGLLNAIEQLDTTDLGEITRKYKSERFGFFSRNYYAQFLAAAQIMLNYKDYFGEVERFAPLRYDVVTLTQSVYLDDLVSGLQIPKDELLALNRDLKHAIIQSKTPLPKNFVLKLPPGKKAVFLAQREQRTNRHSPE
ncbi:lytic transglycosylase catalytic [Candidatus Moduliflexus flocculans]|uniref:Lytic transglycosylase catalytic n=1 Tax=Candidatus Moduliflexus flocculans TaxID=1499966 RepID=A0A081BQ67_9BACT|nr:lytic transglycosylase catalytic [Candidatus Moduliflexus flocculans]